MADRPLAAEIEENSAANPGLAPITVETAFVGEDDGDAPVTIDALAERHFVPDLMKLDIEGGEVDAPRGCARSGPGRPPLGECVVAASDRISARCRSARPNEVRRPRCCPR
ncbi:hypothetical protein GA707_16895 [Nostocoides sp. F2B08]|uniref:hypothetical protein n=1 Tax=Nostocoides sp. F2B08 TaxID=2653936 RepID=UPI0012637F66|nr:hypothetical protein [Tetrasphaera sp. F2B08]KAB7741890.1 hypothetical protein GA707_16895 [Tetrasphaera sp. F2B08]